MTFPTRGGRRKGAGRKPRPDRKGFVPRVARPAHKAAHPAHVTMRAVDPCPSLRSQQLYKAIFAVLAKASSDGFRLAHFSVQHNHIHMLVEADDRVSLWRGVQRLSAWIARTVNRVAHRRGSLWRDRYHRRDLASPSAVRRALVYVLMNSRKHAQSYDEHADYMSSLDMCSSAAWLDGWNSRAGPMLRALRTVLAAQKLVECPVSRPTVWLAREGWKRIGLISPTEQPSHAS